MQQMARDTDHDLPARPFGQWTVRRAMRSRGSTGKIDRPARSSHRRECLGWSAPPRAGDGACAKWKAHPARNDASTARRGRVRLTGLDAHLGP
jgi:hypothetical protein